MITNRGADTSKCKCGARYWLYRVWNIECCQALFRMDGGKRPMGKIAYAGAPNKHTQACRPFRIKEERNPLETLLVNEIMSVTRKIIELEGQREIIKLKLKATRRPKNGKRSR